MKLHSGSACLRRLAEVWRRRTFRRAAVVCLTCGTLLVPGGAPGASGPAAPRTRLHYAPNRNFHLGSAYRPGKAGFNLADVRSVRELGSLPAGALGLVWIGQCNGVDAAFVRAVEPYLRNPAVFGFYLMDDPDPRNLRSSMRTSHRCPADNLKFESDWIHAHAPGAKTFIVLMNMSSFRTPSFRHAYDTVNSHIDLFGLAAYPCRSDSKGCDYDVIDRYVRAAEDAGIPKASIVPIYQAFGAGRWVAEGGARYRLPAPDEEELILARWGEWVEAPAFDFAYSWGSQRADLALEQAPDLQAVFLRHNGTDGLAGRRRDGH